MVRLRIIPVVLCAVSLFPCRVVAAEQSAETLLVDRLLEVGAFKESVTALVVKSVPAGTAADLAALILKYDEQAWKALESDLPGFLKERLSPERLPELARSYGENPEQEWSRSGAEMVTLVSALAAENTSFGKVLARQACSVGLLAPNIDRAREKAGKPAKKLDVPPEAYAELFQPILAPLNETCDCIVQRGSEAFGARFTSEALPKEERNNFIRQLIVDGKCPNPFAAYDGGS